MKKHTMYNLLGVLAFLMVFLLAGLPAAQAADQTDVDKLKQEIDELNKRLDGVETKTLMDKINLGAELRTRFDWYKYKDNDTDYEDKVNGLPSTRFRLNLKADVSDNLKFSSRLTMYKYWGDKTFHMEYDDTYQERKPSDTRIGVERAYVDYFFSPIEMLPMAVTFGRLPTTDGLPTDLRDDTPRKSTYPSLAWDAEVDGLGLTFGLEKLTHMPSSSLKILYTKWCSDNEDAPYLRGEVADTILPTNTPVYAAHFETDMPGKLAGTLFMVSGVYVPTIKLSDDIVNGSTAALGEAIAEQNYAYWNSPLNPYYGAIPGGLTFPNLPDDPVDVDVTGLNGPDTIGKLRKITTFVESREFLGSWVDWFAGFAWETIKSSDTPITVDYSAVIPAPNIANYPIIVYPYVNTSGTVQLPSFMSSTPGEKHNSRAYYVGLRLNLPVKALNNPKIGLEYNHASRFWYGLTGGSEDPLHKLEVRGSVWEAYYIQPITKNFLTRVGYVKVNQDYAQEAFGDPAEVDEDIENMYLLLDVKF